MCICAHMFVCVCIYLYICLCVCIYIYIYIYIYVFNGIEFGLWPLGFMELLQNNNHPAVNKIKCIENRKIQTKKSLGFCRNLYMWLCVHEWAYVCVFVWVVYSACVCEGTCAVHCFYWISRQCILCCYIILEKESLSISVCVGDYN